MNELISVIIPVYKVEKYLKRCIDSVIKQTYEKLEIILVDDGSPDKCPKICDEYAKKDARIRVIHQKNSGLSVARNNGIDIAQGKFIVFVDSDDYIENDMLVKMYYKLKETNADMVMCGVHCVYEDNYIGNIRAKLQIDQDEVINAEQMYERLFGAAAWQYVVAWNKLYSRNIFDSIRFPEGKQHEDEMIIHQIIGKCQKICIVGKPFYHYVCRNDSIMSNECNMHRFDYFYALSNRLRFFAKLGKKSLIQKMCQKYWYEIQKNYCTLVIDKAAREYAKGVLAEFRKDIIVILPNVTCVWKEKIVMIIFAINPYIHKRLFKK